MANGHFSRSVTRDNGAGTGGARSGEFQHRIANDFAAFDGAKLSEKVAACKICGSLFIPRSAASFVITPLVPGSPSLDVKPHSPGETRQSERKKSELKKDEMSLQPFLNS